MHERTPAAAALLRGRAAVVATLTVYLGATAHVSADGHLPGAVALLLLVGAATAVCARFLRREASALRLVALLAVGQALVHVALTTLAGHAGDPRAASTHHPEPGYDGGALTDLFHHLATHLTGSNALMALAHLAAAGVVGLWLAVGERAVWGLVRLAARPVHDGWLLLRATVLVTVAGPRRPERPWRRASVVLPPLHLELITRAVVRRGPPAPLSS